MNKSETNIARSRELVFALIALVFASVAMFFVRNKGIVYPPGDGGMFADIIDQLAKPGAGYPKFVTYNGFEIPFCYPPIAFYVALGFKLLTGLSSTQLLGYLPTLFNTISAGLFVLSARKIGLPENRLWVVGIVFLWTPVLSRWLSFGGGLTRGLGCMFLAAAVLFACDFGRRNWRSFLGYGISVGLALASHLEPGLASILVGIVAGFQFKVWQSAATEAKFDFGGMILRVAVAVVGVLIVVGPWLTRSISWHGLEPFMAARSTGGFSLALAKTNLMTINFVAEWPLPVLALLSIGAAFLVPQSRWLLVATVLIMVMVPRLGPGLLVGPVAVLATFGLCTALDTAVKNKTAQLVVLSMFLAFCFVRSYTSNQRRLKIFDTGITAGQAELIDWIKTSTPADARFVHKLTSNRGTGFTDWFPYAAQRKMDNNAFGTEWLKGTFGEVVHLDTDMLQAKTGEEIAKAVETHRLQKTSIIALKPFDAADQIWIEDLRKSSVYKVLKENDAGVIFGPTVLFR